VVTAHELQVDESLLTGESVAVAPASNGPLLCGTFMVEAFAAIAVGRLANAVACRSRLRPAWRTGLRGNRLLTSALFIEALLLMAFLRAPTVMGLLGGS
jgi:magnesium-transporting ATPase (P-type)